MEDLHQKKKRKEEIEGGREGRRKEGREGKGRGGEERGEEAREG